MEKSDIDSLCFEFFREFSRYEYCLKVTQLQQKTDGDAMANWDWYAKDVEHVFASPKDPRFVAAIDYFTQHPPKKQVVKDGALTWDETPLQEKRVALKIFVLIRRIRNNLFHGGKFNGQWFEPESSEALIQHALIILRACGQSHPEVRKAYESKAL